MPFHFYRALRNESLLSPPLGSAAGGTLVSIELDDTMASDATFLVRARCRFAETVVQASLAPSQRAMLCRSPPSGAGAVAVQLALNGHDFEPAAPLSFVFITPPVLRAVVPGGAPPGTEVALIGSFLVTSAPGAVYHCRFGSQLVAATLHPEARVIANKWQTNSLSCVVPPRPPGAVGVQLSVSLNGQEFTGDDVQFAFL